MQLRISEVFERALERGDISMQALIMFLVYEKQVLTLDDSVRELDLYFLDRHHERMTEELTSYMNKMKFKEKPCVWKVFSKQLTLYIYAENEIQARTYAMSLGYAPLKTVYVDDDDLMSINGKFMTIKESIKGKKPPCVTGSNTEEKI